MITVLVYVVVALLALMLLLFAFGLIARTSWGEKIVGPVGRLIMRVPFLRRMAFSLGTRVLRRQARKQGVDRDATGTPLSDVELALRATPGGEQALRAMSPAQRQAMRNWTSEDIAQMAEVFGSGENELAVGRSARRQVQRAQSGSSGSAGRSAKQRKAVAKRRAARKRK